MRFVGAVLIALIAAAPAAAQNDDGTRPGSAAKPTAQSGKFRKPSAARADALKARAAARRGQQQSSEGATRNAAPPRTGAASRLGPAAARRRAVQPGASRDPAASLSPHERFVIQSELAWIGEYNGPITGEATDKVTAAIRSFQRNRKFKETGWLNTQERALLAAAAKAKQAQVGWSVIDDPATGARLGIPAKQTPNKSQGKTGTRWASAQGQVQIETFRIRETGTALAAVFEQQKKQPANRKIEVSFLRPEMFILAGTQGLKKFHVRADFKDGEVRGVTVLHDPAEAVMDPVVVVMSSAFTAFPGVTGVVQAAVPPPKRKVEYGTGIVASAAGHILTDRQVIDGCDVIVVPGYGNADLQAEDKTADLALLRVYGAPDLVPAALAGDGAKGPDVTLIGIADPQNQGGGSAISAASAQLRGDVIEPAPQLGFSGAAALDSQGRMVGMALLKPQVVAALGGTNVQPRAVLVPVQAIRNFLDAQQLAPASGRGGVEAAKGSLVRVICVRK